MKKEHIEKINKAKSDVDVLNLIVSFYKDGHITIDDILNQDKINLKISPATINYFAVKLSTGKDELKKDKGNAFKLYEYAGKRGNLKAKENEAKFYLNGLGDVDTNYDRVIALCEEIIDKDQNKETKAYLILAETYFQKQEFKKALQYFSLIEDKEDKKIAQERMKEIRSLQLESLYKNKGREKNVLPELKKMTLSKEEKEIPEWENVSPVLDAYHYKENDEILMAEAQLKELEAEIANSALKLLEDKIEKAKEDKLPEKVINILRKQRPIYNKKSNEAWDEHTKSCQIQEASKKAGIEKEIRRETQTEKHFFSPARTHKDEAYKVASLLQKNRLSDKEEKLEVLKIDGIPTRRLITAELSAIITPLTLRGRGKGDYGIDFGWTKIKEENKQGQFISYTQYFGHKETASLGNSEFVYEQKLNPHANHLGDYYMYHLGDYKQIMRDINRITAGDEEAKKNNERELANYMLRFAKEGISISIAELKKFNSSMDEENYIYNKNVINRILYHCFVKEPVRWMLPRDGGHEIPFAIAQMRAVKLIAHGVLRMEDVFSQNADYGVFTGVNIGNNITKVSEKIEKINRLYNETFLKESSKYSKAHTEFFKIHNEVDLVTTRKELHEELKEFYGGDSDTDGEGYDSDTAENLYPEAFKF